MLFLHVSQIHRSHVLPVSLNRTSGSVTLASGALQIRLLLLFFIIIIIIIIIWLKKFNNTICLSVVEAEPFFKRDY